MPDTELLRPYRIQQKLLKTKPDSGIYLEPAMALLKQRNYGHIFVCTPRLSDIYSSFFYLFGYNLSAIIIVQLILSIIPIFCGYLITRRLFNDRAGLITAVFFGCRLSFFQLRLFCANRLSLRADAKPSFFVWRLGINGE